MQKGQLDWSQLACDLPFKHCIERKIEGRMEVMERRGIICKQLLDELKDTRGYCELTEEALDHTVWRTGFGGGCGSFVRQQHDEYAVGNT
jgi:hypothetical protein